MEPNTVSNYLNYDYSISDRMKEEQSNGFLLESVSPSPLKGRIGYPFQAYQGGPSYHSPAYMNLVESETLPAITRNIKVGEAVELPGLQGARGFIGDMGYQRELGIGFVKGPIGLTGPAGPKGDMGRLGRQGPDGQIGPEGPASLETGPASLETGPQGTTGPGPSGPIGPEIIGDMGSTGLEGGGLSYPGCDCCIGTEDVWVNFPDPVYPGEGTFDGPQYLGMSGQSHSFFLYCYNKDGDKEIFWPRPNLTEWTNTSETQHYSDPNDIEGSLITTGYEAQKFPFSGKGLSTDDHFLAENVATDFTKSECEMLGAYRKGIGNWSVNNRIEGFGVCGCSEEDVVVEYGGPNLIRTADQVRSDAANAMRNHSHTDQEFCTDHPWYNCYWDTHTAIEQNDFKINSRGRFLVGEATYFSGWDGNQDNAQVFISGCSFCEGCRYFFDNPPGPAHAKNCHIKSDDRFAYNEQEQGYNFMDCDGNCFTLKSPGLVQYTEYDLALHWGVGSCDDKMDCGYWSCDSNPEFGPQYDGDGDLTSNQGRKSIHGLYEGMCDWEECEQHQCCSDSGQGNPIPRSDFATHGPYVGAVNWEGYLLTNSNTDIYFRSDSACIEAGYGGRDESSDSDSELLYNENHGHLVGTLMYLPPDYGVNGMYSDAWSTPPNSATYPDNLTNIEKMKYIIPGIGGVEGSQKHAPAFVLAPGEYTKDDIFPAQHAWDTPGKSAHPEKPFPSLVMNGKLMGEKLREYIALYPEKFPDPIPEQMDIHTLVITQWQVVGLCSTGGSAQDYGMLDDAYPIMPLKDPWPDQAPRAEEYSSFAAGGLDFGSLGQYGATDGKRDKALWHCRVGGVEGSTEYATSNDSNWDECDYCLGQLQEKDNILNGEFDFWTSHAGYRMNLGVPAYSFHGFRSWWFNWTGGMWDSFDNGVSCFQSWHILDGTYAAIFFEPDTQNDQWEWHENSVGPFKRTMYEDGPVSYWSGGRPINEGASGEPGGGPRSSRMEEYIADFFGVQKWSIILDPDMINASVIAGGSSSENASYYTLTDYTISDVCTSV